VGNVANKLTNSANNGDGRVHFGFLTAVSLLFLVCKALRERNS
jgi:hypothetical protein